jgi:hypothetical protein
LGIGGGCSFNNEKPFFTSCHPFWTQHGWKAIDPEGAKTENTWLMVGQLKEGDFVRKIKYHDRNSKSVVHTWEEIERIERLFIVETKQTHFMFNVK